MKVLSLQKISLLLLLNICFSIAVSAQTVLKSDVVNISLTGTSTLHDWEMKAGKGSSDATFLVDKKGNVTSLSKLTITLAVKNLKSEHKAMDNYTYKALRTEKNPNLSFVLTSSTITPTGDDNYNINCTGKMTIAGKTKIVSLFATGHYNNTNKTFVVKGVEKMKMTDFDVTPPKVMLGTIKTGNDISISYNVKFSK